MASTLKIKKFTGKNSFNLSHIKMCALLKEQGVWASLSSNTSHLEKSVIGQQEEKAHSLILLSLSDERRLFGLRMNEGTLLKDHLDDLNLILMELCDTDVKMEDEDIAMIPLSSFPPSYENIVNYLSIGKDCITLKEVKSEEKKKGKEKKGKADLKDIYNYCNEPGHWKKDCPKKRKKYFVATTVQDETSSESNMALSVEVLQQCHSE
ncbi:Zinc finger, CCHC-type [Sesbania bispinosa]|nr:Zinc finger, CCHC-type [Sesbania bispinosa]